MKQTQQTMFKEVWTLNIMAIPVFCNVTLHSLADVYGFAGDPVFYDAVSI